jgi:hypothetical protein
VEVLSENLLEKIKERKMNYISMNRGTCIYLPNFKKIYKKNKEEVHNCTLESKNLIDHIIYKKPNSIIILGGNFKEHFNQTQDWKYQSNYDSKPLDSFIKSLNKLLSDNYKIILIYPIPGPEFHVIKRLMQKIPKSTFDASKYLKENQLTFSLEKYYLQNQNIIDAFNNLNHKNLIKVYPEKIFCNKEINKCYTHNEKEIFFSDKQHLAKTGVKMLNKEIEKSIDNFLKD